jgi:tight adherence protein C
MLLGFLVFLSATLAAAGLYLWLVPDRARQRVQALADPLAGDGWQETLVKLAGPLAQLSAPQGDWDTSPLRIKLMQAGLRGKDVRLWYFGAKTVLPALLAFLTYLVVSPGPLPWLQQVLFVTLSALVGVYLPNLLIELVVRGRRREILDHFPDATDLMLVCMEAGLGMDSALARVAEELHGSSPALSEELHLTNLEVRAGVTRDQALHHLALRTGVEEISTFALMLKQADRFGTSIGESLRVYSQELRHKRMVRAEELAAMIPTKLLLPLVLCIFPSIIMVVLGPAVIRIVRQMLPLLSGQA